MEDGTGRRYKGKTVGGDDNDPNRWSTGARGRDRKTVMKTFTVTGPDALEDLAGFLPEIHVEFRDAGTTVVWHIGPARR
ncbi:MAG: hypothetical protein ABWZ58_05550 [Acidimicrobiia bacterium]